MNSFFFFCFWFRKIFFVFLGGGVFFTINIYLFLTIKTSQSFWLLISLHCYSVFINLSSPFSIYLSISVCSSLSLSLFIYIYQSIFLSLRVFGLLSSSLLLFPQRFGRYNFRPSSDVCRTREPTRNFEQRPLLNPRGSPVLVPLAITGYKC